MDNDDALITARYKSLESVLDERQRRRSTSAITAAIGWLHYGGDEMAPLRR
jgi:hypothetical protein